MPKNPSPRLLYDPMPKEDLKLPPLKEPGYVFSEARTQEGKATSADVSRLLTNLAFN